MIRDEFLKRFIVFQYNKHIDKDIKMISFISYKILACRFLRNEKVLFIKESCYGNIINRNKNKYNLFLDNNTFIQNVPQEELKRIEPISAESIFSYLFFITVSTPFNVRLLKKNIFDEFFKKSNLCKIATHKFNDHSNNYKINQSKKKLLKKIECNEVSVNLELSRSSVKLNEVNERLIIDCSKIKKSKDLTASDLSQDQIKQLNINILSNVKAYEKYLIETLDFHKTHKILKIFAFVKNFTNDKISSDFTIHNLVKSFKEPAYNADIIGHIHEYLIDNLIDELEKYGITQLLCNLKSVIDSLPEHNTIGEVKKKNDIGLKIWKVKARAFLWDLQSRTNNKMIFSYYVMLSKKKVANITEAFDVRLDLLEFLISCYFTTKIFRDILLNELKTLEDLETKSHELEKNIQLEEAAMKDNNDKRSVHQIQVKLIGVKNELNEIKNAIVYSPTKSDIGTINQAKFLFIDNVVYASKRNKFYTLSQRTLINIATFYIPTDKIESVALISLKNVIEALYK